MIISTLSGVVVIAILTQLIKGFAEAIGLSPDNPLHDPVIWLTAFALGIGGYIVSAAIDAPLTGAIVRDAAGQGLLAAFSAVGTYSLATHPYFKSASTVVTPVGPVAPASSAQQPPATTV